MGGEPQQRGWDFPPRFLTQTHKTPGASQARALRSMDLSAGCHLHIHRHHETVTPTRKSDLCAVFGVVFLPADQSLSW